MRLTRTHLGLLAALALVLGGGAAGFVLGTGSQPAQAASASSAAGQIDAQDFDAAIAAAGFALDPTTDAAAPSGAPAANAGGAGAVVRALLGRQVALGRAARVLVHAQATVDLPQRGLQTFAVDHGTVGRIDATSLTITEADGATVSFTLDAATRVRSRGAGSTIGAVTPGSEVIVVSQQSGAGWHGLAVVVVPPRAAAPASPAAPAASATSLPSK